MYAVSTRSSALEKGATRELPAFSSLSGHLRAPVVTNERAVPTRRAARLCAVEHGDNASVEAGQAQGQVSPRAAVNDDVERHPRLDGVPRHAASKQRHAAAQKQAAGRPAK